MKTADFLKNELNRRQFLGSSAKNAAGVAAGMVSLSATVAHAAPNERVSLGVIGVRGRGKTLAGQFAAFGDVDVSTICDVDRNVLAAASERVEKQQGYAPRVEHDFRRVIDDPTIDAVVIATPDHWHASMMILACQAGKDVYVEKPVSHNFVEGGQMLAAARKYERVVQTGMQQRSGAHFQSAIDFVRSGKLGQVKLAKAWAVHRRKSIGFKKNCKVPAGVDYDLWLGPAAKRAFNPNQFHQNWHWFWDFGSGELGNWGVHMLDIARWGLAVDLPERISASGGKLVFNDDQQTPDSQIVTYNYPDKTIVWEHRLWSNRGIEGRSAAAAFYGEQGTLIVDRGGWKVYDRKDSISADTSEMERTHCRNFIDSIKDRSTPAADIEVGHVSTALCHLGNIAYRLGREVTFDSKTMQFPNDDDATALMTREYRSPWTLPEI